MHWWRHPTRVALCWQIFELASFTTVDWCAILCVDGKWKKRAENMWKNRKVNFDRTSQNEVIVIIFRGVTWCTFFFISEWFQSCHVTIIVGIRLVDAHSWSTNSIVIGPSLFARDGSQACDWFRRAITWSAFAFRLVSTIIVIDYEPHPWILFHGFSTPITSPPSWIPTSPNIWIVEFGSSYLGRTSHVRTAHAYRETTIQTGCRIKSHFRPLQWYSLVRMLSIPGSWAWKSGYSPLSLSPFPFPVFVRVSPPHRSSILDVCGTSSTTDKDKWRARRLSRK